MTEKKEEKKPLDMTTDEAMEFLFGEEGAEQLKQAVQGMNPPPPEDETNGSKGKSKSARKDDTT